jgi:uncharacterized repeat protein (TIGR01451 family)
MRRTTSRGELRVQGRLSMKRILLVAVACGALFFGAAQPASAQLQEIIDLLGIANTKIGMGDTPGQVSVGEEITYRLNVRNNGPSAANAVLVQTRLAESLEFVEASGEVLAEEGPPPSDVECNAPSAALVNCRMDRLEAGRLARVFVTVTATQAGFPQSRASVESQDIDLRPADNDDQEGTVVSDDGVEEVPAGATEEGTESDAEEGTEVR